jgi:transcriptional regulator with XRE-family HTH domain
MLTRFIGGVSMPEPTKLGVRIKTFRTRAGLTQDELARRSGVPRQTIGFVETGIQKSLSLENAIKLAKALNITVDYLAGSMEEECAAATV